MTAPETALTVQNLSVTFDELQVLKSINFLLSRGETLVVLGESGCGKTTLLRALAGLVPVQSGEIQLMHNPTTQRPPRDRGVLYLDQEPLLFEHLTVFENVAFAMRMKRTSEARIQSEVQKLLAATDLTSHASKRDRQLSGGQRQRVAFARAVLARPQLLLLDEPFGSLDSKTRAQMQVLFAELRVRYGLTSIFVTHDAREALTVGDQFARMSSGQLITYPDRDAFVRDPATGIPSEISFWEDIQHRPSSSPVEKSSEQLPR